MYGYLIRCLVVAEFVSIRSPREHLDIEFVGFFLVKIILY